MKAIDQGLGAADRFQRRWPVLGFPVAVWTKFNDDQAGNLAALIAYYGFTALFPMLLLLSTVLSILLKNDPSLQRSLVNSALAQYPLIGTQIQHEVKTLPGSGIPLVLGSVFLLLGARGVAAAMQNALCELWGIPRERRPSFPLSALWGLLLMLTVGIGFIATTFLSGLAGGAAHVLSGTAAHVGTIAVSLLLNVGLFWLSFRLATFRKVRWRDLLTGATIAAVVWQVLQLAGGYVVGHLLHRANELYGTFGLVLGLLAWLFLEAQVTLYAAEVDVVLAKRLWPRSLPGTAAGPVGAEAAAPEAAAASERVRAPDGGPGVPGQRPAREDRTGSTVRGDGKTGKSP